jgi:MarR family transcriptional regulator, negative regulator of the multidrug operon emrRAB
MNENTLNLLRLLVKSGHLAEIRLDTLLADLDLSATRLWTLQHLQQSDRPQSPGSIANCMAFAKSNATQLVDHLEAGQLLRRVPDASDRRCTHLDLTEAGRERVQSALETLQPLLARLEQTFTPQEQEQLVNLLRRLNEAIQQP